MIYPSTQAIYDTLTAHELRCGIEEREDVSVVHLGVTTEKTNFEVQYISRRDVNDVAMRVYNLLKFPQEKTYAMMTAANNCNVAYRFFKFNVDQKASSVDVEYDFPAETPDIGEAAMELLQRAADVIDRSYPELMKVISG